MSINYIANILCIFYEYKFYKINYQVNWNILVTWGLEINRDLISSGERKLKSLINNRF